MAITFVTKSGGTVRAFDDAAARRGLTGGTAVLTVGQQMKYEIISGNTLRVYDGVFMLQGRQVNIDPNTYEDFVFDVGTQNQVRYDICGFEYKKTDTAESMEKFITKNVGASGKPTEKDLWSGATSAQGGLYRVKFNGVSIQSVEPLFTTMPILANLYGAASVTLASGVTEEYATTLKRVGRIIIINFALQGTFSTKTHSHIFTIPDGYRPNARVYTAGHSGSDGPIQVRIDADGKVYVWNSVEFTTPRGTIVYVM